MITRGSSAHTRINAVTHTQTVTHHLNNIFHSCCGSQWPPMWLLCVDMCEQCGHGNRRRCTRTRRCSHTHKYTHVHRSSYVSWCHLAGKACSTLSCFGSPRLQSNAHWHETREVCVCVCVCVWTQVHTQPHWGGICRRVHGLISAYRSRCTHAHTCVAFAGGQVWSYVAAESSVGCGTHETCECWVSVIVFLFIVSFCAVFGHFQSFTWKHSAHFLVLNYFNLICRIFWRNCTKMFGVHDLFAFSHVLVSFSFLLSTCVAFYRPIYPFLIVYASFFLCA